MDTSNYMLTVVADVKVRRTKMEQRSIDTRAKVTRAAYDLFCENGFRATTMEAIGAAAGVSVQTVYFQFRTKNEVLRAVHEWTVLGDEGLPPEAQPWYVAAVAEPTAARALACVVAGSAQLNARIAPTLPIYATLAKEAAGDIYRTSRRLRREGMEQLLTALSAKAPIRADISRNRATDLLDFLMGPESYAELVLRAGWSPQDWTDWVCRTLTEQLFGDSSS